MIRCAANRFRSTDRLGIAPWPPGPLKVINISSTEAMYLPDLNPTSPTLRGGWTCCPRIAAGVGFFKTPRSEEHTSELQSRGHLVCRLLLEKKKKRATVPMQQ